MQWSSGGQSFELQFGDLDLDRWQEDWWTNVVYDGYVREDTSGMRNNDEGGSGNQLDVKFDI